MSSWYSFTEAMHEANALPEVTRIAVVGKYTALPDAYLSVIEALHHSGVTTACTWTSSWWTARRWTRTTWTRCSAGMDGILVPGGFGQRGLEGKIAAHARRARQRIPYLGICLGLQVAVCEFARTCAGSKGRTPASSTRPSAPAHIP